MTKEWGRTEIYTSGSVPCTSAPACVAVGDGCGTLFGLGGTLTANAVDCKPLYWSSSSVAAKMLLKIVKSLLIGEISLSLDGVMAWRGACRSGGTLDVPPVMLTSEGCMNAGPSDIRTCPAV